MTGYLIRHADAGQRGTFDGPDLERALSKKGHGEAAAIAARLRSAGVTHILSSRAVRCAQTVGPLARSLDLEVEIDDRLTEGSDPGDVVDLLVDRRKDNIAMCSHGDIIPEVIRLLMLRGIEFERSSTSTAKASIWTIDLAGEAEGIVSYRKRP